MPGTVFVRGDRLTLTTVSPEDYEYLASLHNEPANREQAGISLPWTDSDVAELVEERTDAVVFLVCHEDDAVGSVLLADLDHQARTAEIGYTIERGERTQGYATEAVELCLAHAFEDRDLHKVRAQVVGDNEASKRVLERTGFQQEGVLREEEYADGERHDVFYYGLLRSEW